jgi:hypothetical protein
MVLFGARERISRKRPGLCQFPQKHRSSAAKLPMKVKAARRMAGFPCHRRKKRLTAAAPPLKIEIEGLRFPP